MRVCVFYSFLLPLFEIYEKLSSSCSDNVNMWCSVLLCLLDYCRWSLNFKFAERFIYMYSVILGPSRSSMVYIHILYQSIRSLSLSLSLFVQFLFVYCLLCWISATDDDEDAGCVCVCAFFLFPKPFYCLRAALAKTF